jgi:transcriptional repressor NrdR
MLPFGGADFARRAVDGSPPTSACNCAIWWSLKSNGRREDFDRTKLERSIRIALQKRPVEPERMDQMISGIVRRLESMGDTDIPSTSIGEIVMESLARIDTVAFVRFASVYKNFQAADDFDKFVSELRPNLPP